MTLKKKKINRKISISSEDSKILELTPNWKFSVESKNSGVIIIDLSYLQHGNRKDLAIHMRDALWSLRHESEIASLKTYESSIKRFWNFLEDIDSNDQKINKLEKLDRECIDKYLVWLEMQTIPTKNKNGGSKLSPVFLRTLYSGLKTILVNRQKCVPAMISPKLSFPHNPFPNSNQYSTTREPYSQSEHKRILAALNLDLDLIHKEADSLPSLQILVVYLLIFAATTGANLQPLLELKRDSLSVHPIGDRDILTTIKRRGKTTFATSVRKIQSTQDASRTPHAIPLSIGEHFRNLCKLTQPLTATIQNYQDSVFLWKISRGKRKNQTILLTSKEAKTGIRNFSKRHKILNDSGNILNINFSRFRPTFATELYRRSKDIRSVSRALGHSSIETTAKSYIRLPPEADRNHALVAESMVSQFTQTQFEGKIMLAADGKIPVQNMSPLLAGGYSTGIARCANPFREIDSVCKKFFTCFKCPNMMVFEDDLWRLYSFYYRLLAERPKLNPAQWMKTYGPIIRRIDDDIAPLFPSEKIAVAKHRAKTDSHPTWKDPLL